jgi:hypothetical protein
MGCLVQVPHYPECHGLSCHTSELPYVFNNLDVIHKEYSIDSEPRNSSTITRACPRRSPPFLSYTSLEVAH